MVLRMWMKDRTSAGDEAQQEKNGGPGDHEKKAMSNAISIVNACKTNERATKT